MASGAAGLSTIIPPFVPAPTFGGGTTTTTDTGASAPTTGTSSQPTGVNIPAEAPERQAETQPGLITLANGQQGVYQPKKADYVSYSENSGVGGYQDIMNLMKNIHSGIQNPNQTQLNSGKTNQLDNSGNTYNFDSATSPTAPATTGAVTGGTTGGLGGGIALTPPPTTPSQVEPTYQGLPTTITPAYGADTGAQIGVAAAGGGLNSVTGTATTFGLQPNTIVNDDGTVDSKYYDREDTNPKTAFGYNAKDPNLRGVSLPVDVLKQTIGDYTKDPKIYQMIKSGQYRVAVTNPATGETKIVNIVDAGPGVGTGNAADVTFRTQKELGFNGKNPASIQIIGPDGSTIPIKGYHAGTVSTTPTAQQTTSTETPPAKPAQDVPKGSTIPQAEAITEAKNVLPQESPTDQTSGALLPNISESAPPEGVPPEAEEYKKGGLVKKMQTGGLVPQQSGIPEQAQPPIPPPPMPPPPMAPQPFEAHVQLTEPQTDVIPTMVQQNRTAASTPQQLEEGGQVYPSYTTPLSPDEEKDFQKWVKDNKIPWQDEPKADYDMRGFWKAQQSGDPDAIRDTKTHHFPDTWKTPYHKTFSNESIYAGSDAPHWEGNKLVPGIAEPSQVEPTSPIGGHKYIAEEKEGGKIPGKGDTDSVPALLQPGEYVIPKEVVEKIGKEKLDELVRKFKGTKEKAHA